MVIDAKRVDAGEVTKTTLEVKIPETELGQRYQLTDLVHELYPEAEFRSFGGDAASFLAPKLLIVATYRRAPVSDRGSEKPDTQPRLFEA